MGHIDYFGDYFGWGGGDSSRSKYKSSLGWNSDKLTSSTLSYFNTRYDSSSVDKDQEKIKKAYNTVRDIVVILDFPFPVDIIISKRTFLESTKNKYIYISSDIFDNVSYSSDDQITIFCGKGVHEAAHLRYTELSVVRSFRDAALTKFSEKYSISDDNFDFLKFIFNIIEDERVEDNLLSERPGYVDFVDKHKLYLYKQVVNSSFSKNDFINRFIKNLYRVIRYPENIESDIIEKYNSTFLNIKNILSTKANSTKESCQKSLEIVKAIYDTFPDLELLKTSLIEGSEKIDCDGKVSKPSMFSNKGTEEIFSGFDSCLSKQEVKRLGSSGRFNSEKLESGSLVERLVFGESEYGTNTKTIFTKVKGNKSKYEAEKKIISKYVNGIKKAVNGKDKNYEFVIPSCRTGKLDTNKLAEAYQGVPQVYTRLGKVETNKTTVCILIDESGSMRGRAGSSDRITLAREAAILLNEGFGHMPGVDLYIYGHSADELSTGFTEINIYREGKYFNPNSSLSSVDAHWNNRDGDAIIETANRVRKFTDSRCIMFVLSDGSPSAIEYGGCSAIKDTHEKVKQAEKLGFDIIQVSICKVPHVEEMFDKYIEIKDISELPKNLSGIVKRTVLKNKKTKITR